MIGLDARGFLFGPLIALRLGAAFVPVRKQGKLPGDCVQAVYKKEYGEVRKKKGFFYCSNELTVLHRISLKSKSLLLRKVLA